MRALIRIGFLLLLAMAGLSGQTVRPFEFHSNFWTNLHHFLYQQALANAAAPGLSSNESAAWSNALEFYKRTMISRDLLQDREMTRIDTVLAEAEDRSSLEASAGLNDELKGVLNGTASVYRNHWWKEHDRSNRFWIQVATPLVKEFGTQLMQQIATAYDVGWPQRPVRVEVSVYANWAGAYTYGDDPVHTIVASIDSRGQGFTALEILFHEATHGMVFSHDGRLDSEITRQCKNAGIDVPDNLWHAIIFFTAGELVRRALSGVGVKTYEPDAQKTGLYARAGWTRYESALELFWKPHLEGRLSLDQAIERIVRALSEK